MNVNCIINIILLIASHKRRSFSHVIIESHLINIPLAYYNVMGIESFYDPN